MKILRVVQRNFDFIGISPNREFLNQKVLTIIFVSVSGMSSLFIFFFHEANTAQEYMEFIYIVTAAIGTSLSAANTVFFVKKKLFSFIDSVDGHFNESKSNGNNSNPEKLEVIVIFNAFKIRIENINIERDL